MVKELWLHLSSRRRKQFLIILIPMIFSSLLEVISIGSVLPFLGVLISPGEFYEYSWMQPIIQYLNLSTPEQLIFPFTVIFICATLIAGLTRLLLLYAITKLSYATGADLSIDIYRKTLYQDYLVHINNNSSKVINGIINKTNIVISGVITPILMLISSTVLVVFIVITLFAIDVTVAISTLVGLGGFYWIVISYVRYKLQENSQRISTYSNNMIKTLQEGLGGIRDVLLDNAQKFYCHVYRKSDLPLRKAMGMNVFISGSPRFVIESIAMTIIAGLAYIMSMREGGLTMAIPVLGGLALGAQRLLPSLQQVYSAYSSIKGSQSSLQDVLDFLDQSLPSHFYLPAPKPMLFEKMITLENLGFSFDNKNAFVFDGVNLNFHKGSCVGFVGETGSGKSTIIDILMGLLTPTSGQVLIDKIAVTTENVRAWQARIAHVPQNIYLSDSSIEENIAFGMYKKNIDHDRVKDAAKKAQISEFIESLEDGYGTTIGEHGVKLSGGQRQRIGIARAFYKQADVLVLDEATSALDSKTELEVMKSIKSLNKNLTIFIIAHRITTLKDCDTIVQLGNKDISIVTYEEIADL